MADRKSARAPATSCPTNGGPTGGPSHPGVPAKFSGRQSSIRVVISYRLLSVSARTRASNRGVGAILKVRLLTFALLLFAHPSAQVLIAGGELGGETSSRLQGWT